MWTTAPYGPLPAFVVEKSCAIAFCSKVRVPSAAFFGSNHFDATVMGRERYRPIHSGRRSPIHAIHELMDDGALGASSTSDPMQRELAPVPEQARFLRRESGQRLAVVDRARGPVTCPVTRPRYCGLMEPFPTVPGSVTGFDVLSDDELVERVKHLSACERRASVALIRSLVQFDSRQLYLREGCSSLFTYCTHVLHLSEGSSYNRIETASPELETSGPMSRALSSSAGQNVAATPAPQFRAAVVTPLAPERYKLQVTLTRETHEKLGAHSRLRPSRLRPASTIS